MKSKQKSLPTNIKADVKNLKATLLEEIPALPKKFYTFTHERISMMWLHETSRNPIRGNRLRQK